MSGNSIGDLIRRQLLLTDLDLLARLAERLRQEVSVAQQETLVYFAERFGTPTELNAHGAVEITQSQVDEIRAAFPITSNGVTEPRSLAGIPVWIIGGES